MSRVAPYGKTDATGLTAADELALRAVLCVLADIEARADLDPGSAQPLACEMLALLLGPGGRTLLPHVPEIVARLLVHRVNQVPEVGVG